MVYCNGCSVKGCEFRSLFDAKCSRFKPLTNADRIRAMTDEELAECLYDITDNGYSADQWLEWLRKETE